MRKKCIILFILLAQLLFSKTSEENKKDAVKYSEKSKQAYIIAGVAFAFVIAVKYFNRNSDKKD